MMWLEIGHNLSLDRHFCSSPRGRPYGLEVQNVACYTSRGDQTEPRTGLRLESARVQGLSAERRVSLSAVSGVIFLEQHYPCPTDVIGTRHALALAQAHSLGGLQRSSRGTPGRRRNRMA